jgi:hypothetical protein
MSDYELMTWRALFYELDNAVGWDARDSFQPAERNIIKQCGVCAGFHHVMREHCPYCSSRRVFIASHSFEFSRVDYCYRNSQRLAVEVVRAFRSDLAFQFIAR